MESNNFLMDNPIAEINQLLKAKLPWLQNAFGRANKLVKKLNDKDFFYPGVYNGNSEYLNVMPGEYNGNFSFFYITGYQKIETFRPWTKIAGNVSLIFFVNLDTIFPDNDIRHTEELKDEIIRALKTNKSKLELVEITENPEEVYKEFSFREIDYQYQMHPYFCIRFNTTIKYETCND